MLTTLFFSLSLSLFLCSSSVYFVCFPVSFYRFAFVLLFLLLLFHTYVCVFVGVFSTNKFLFCLIYSQLKILAHSRSLSLSFVNPTNLKSAVRTTRTKLKFDKRNEDRVTSLLSIQHYWTFAPNQNLCFSAARSKS